MTFKRNNELYMRIDTFKNEVDQNEMQLYNALLSNLKMSSQNVD